MGTGQAKKRGRPATIQSNPDQSSQQTPTETLPKKKRGRPPKASKTQIKTREQTPAGIGVLIGDDGHAYLSSTTTTVRLTSSQPINSTETAEEVQRHGSSQPTTSSMQSPLKKGGKQVFPKSELKK